MEATINLRTAHQMRKLLFISLMLLTGLAQAISLKSAFESHTSNVQVRGEGIVIRILNDDNQGSRHQKFVLKLPSGQTILIAHNIDLAPRINSISTGDRVHFYGQYEWSQRAGVVHWTHHDPQGHHIGGWLQHQGRKYH